MWSSPLDFEYPGLHSKVSCDSGRSGIKAKRMSVGLCTRTTVALMGAGKPHSPLNMPHLGSSDPRTAVSSPGPTNRL